jgi:alkaline phosphatase
VDIQNLTSRFFEKMVKNTMLVHKTFHESSLQAKGTKNIDLKSKKGIILTLSDGRDTKTSSAARFLGGQNEKNDNRRKLENEQSYRRGEKLFRRVRRNSCELGK